MRSLLMMSDIILERYGITSGPDTQINQEANNERAMSMLLSAGVAKIG